MNKKLFYIVPFLFSAFACSSGVAYTGANIETVKEPVQSDQNTERTGKMAAGNFGRIESISGNSITISTGTKNRQGLNSESSGMNRPMERKGFMFEEGEQNGETLNNERPVMNRSEKQKNLEGDIAVKERTEKTPDQNSDQDLDTSSAATKEQRGKDSLKGAETSEGTAENRERPSMDGEMKEGFSGRKNRGEIQEFEAQVQTVTYTLSNTAVITNEQEDSSMNASDLKAGDLIRFELDGDQIVKIMVLNGMNKGETGNKEGFMNREGQPSMNGEQKTPSAQQGSDKEVKLHTRDKNEDTENENKKENAGTALENEV